jgi:hypothetical protein
MTERSEGMDVPLERRVGPDCHWNYRVIEFADPKTGEAWRAIHEVHYENGEPVAYSEPHASVVWDAADDGAARPLQILAQMAGALERPMLVESDFKRPNAGLEARGEAASHSKR